MVTIYTDFNKLKLEKKRNIINVAIKEFVEEGYDRASTNQIVNEAKISKGSLFNYFNSKKDLYVYLIDYSRNVIDEFLEQIDLSETDLFNRIENIGFQKLYIHQKFPHVFDFLASLQQEEAVAVKDIIKQKLGSIYDRGFGLLYKNIDYSKFREDIDIEKAFDILKWTMFGFGDKAIKEIDSFANSSKLSKHFIKEWKVYSEILKLCFYK